MNSGLLSVNRVCLLNCKRFLRRKVPQPGKPPILPPSKQVLYRVVNGDWVEPEYVEELLWRRHVYNNAILSIRTLFKEEIKIREKEGLGIEELKKQELVELEKLIQINEERNAKAANERKEREIVAMKNLENETVLEVEKELKEQEENKLIRTEEVLKCIEESKNFITHENLRSKIEEALDNPTNFEFAIDLNGNHIISPLPVKYLEGHPTRQKGRLYDSMYKKLVISEPENLATNVLEKKQKTV